MRVLPSLNLLQPGRGLCQCGLKEGATPLDTAAQALPQLAAAAGCGFVDTLFCGQDAGLIRREVDAGRAWTGVRP